MQTSVEQLTHWPRISSLSILRGRSTDPLRARTLSSRVSCTAAVRLNCSSGDGRLVACTHVHDSRDQAALAPTTRTTQLRHCLVQTQLLLQQLQQQQVRFMRTGCGALRRRAALRGHARRRTSARLHRTSCRMRSIAIEIFGQTIK